MKAIILSLILMVVTTTCFSQTNDFSLIGKWKEIEYHGNNGATDVVQKIEDGRTFIFGKNNVFKDGDGNIGTYNVSGDSLHIKATTGEMFFLFYPDNNNGLSLNPVNKNYEYICDEGCAYVFKKEE